MKCLLSVSLAVAAGLAAYAMQNYKTPKLRVGIAVNLPTTKSAVAMPAADDEDAWVVTVTPNGSIYFGLDKVDPDNLVEKINGTPRKREQNLYIKVDARAPFGSVKPVLAAARECLFETPVLLTTQPGQARPGTIVPPKGLEVMVTPPSNADKTSVQLWEEGQLSPSLRIDGKAVSWPDFESTLKNVLQSRKSKMAEVEANDAVPFEAIVRVIDEAHADGATVALPSFHSI